MPVVSYYAWFLVDYRPRARADTDAQKQPMIEKGTKVSVKEVYERDGAVWCQFWAPPGYTLEVGYPELWVPRSVLSIKPPEEEVVISLDVPDAVVAAFVTIAKWLKS